MPTSAGKEWMMVMDERRKLRYGLRLMGRMQEALGVDWAPAILWGVEVWPRHAQWYTGVLRGREAYGEIRGNNKEIMTNRDAISDQLRSPNDGCNPSNSCTICPRHFHLILPLISTSHFVCSLLALKYIQITWTCWGFIFFRQVC